MRFRRTKRVFLTMLPVLMFFVLNLLGGHLCAKILDDSIVGTIMGDILLLIAGSFWYCYMRIPFHKVNDITKKQALMFFFILLFVWYSSQMGAMFIGAMFPTTLDSFHQGIQVNVTAYLVLTVLVAPAAEELMFRGVFYTQMRKLFGPMGACFVSTLVFAFMHSTPSQVYLAFICGILFCTIYELTSSMLYSIVLHMVYNILCVFVGTVTTSSLFWLIMMQSLMIAVVVILFYKVAYNHKMSIMYQNVCIRG